MTTRILAAMTAALAVTTALPAMAAVDMIGSVDIGYGRNRGVRSFDFGGPVESLRLSANRDVDCRSVRATFANGNTREIFSGRLDRDQAKDVELPGNRRDITRIDFRCGAMNPRGSTIQISADVGRYRDAWRRGPNWGATWAHVFNWGSNAVNNWQYVGKARFVGRHDSDEVDAGDRGRHSDAIALKPVDASARCTRVTATFDNGHTQNLDFHGNDYLQQGEYHSADLPGNYRNIERISMDCRPTDARSVTMQIYTSK